MNHPFDDSLDDLLGGAMAPDSRKPLAAPPATYRPQHVEPCKKCNGTGRFITYTGRQLGPCFACKGAGKKTFAASAPDRAKARAQAAGRKAQRLTDDIAAFGARNPAVRDWLAAEAAKPVPFAFAIAMLEALGKFGDLTERQLATCQRLAANAALRAADRAKASAEAVAAAPVVDGAGVDRLKAAFDSAVAYQAAKGLRLRTPKMTVGDMVISPAPAHGKNPGAIYVKGTETEVYFGKVAGGKFYASRDCDATRAAKVAAFIADPMKAAEVYGQTTGTCCICNATLRSDWKYRGIGPICAQKFGW